RGRAVAERSPAVPGRRAGGRAAGVLAAGGAAADVLRSAARRAADLRLPVRRRDRADLHLRGDRLAARLRPLGGLRDQLRAGAGSGSAPAAAAGAGSLPVTAIRRCLNRSRRPDAPRSRSTARAAAAPRAAPAPANPSPRAPPSAPRGSRGGPPPA